jgi:hypothetical protein
VTAGAELNGFDAPAGHLADLVVPFAHTPTVGMGRLAAVPEGDDVVEVADRRG